MPHFYKRAYKRKMDKILSDMLRRKYFVFKSKCNSVRYVWSDGFMYNICIYFHQRLNTILFYIYTYMHMFRHITIYSLSHTHTYIYICIYITVCPNRSMYVCTHVNIIKLILSWKHIHYICINMCVYKETNTYNRIYHAKDILVTLALAQLNIIY